MALVFAELGEGGVYRGHEGTRRYMNDLSEAWEIARADVDDAVGVGDVALLAGRIHYRGRGREPKPRPQLGGC